MTNGDVSSHLKVSSLHVRFESLMAREFGHTEVRRMVSEARFTRARRHHPATPVAWSAVAADRVAAGKSPGEVVAPLGDLGVFCVALGAVTMLSAMPHAHDPNARPLPDRLDLETAEPARLRIWAVELLPRVVDAFAVQAPRWWMLGRRRFARMVLYRLAVPAY